MINFKILLNDFSRWIDKNFNILSNLTFIIWVYLLTHELNNGLFEFVAIIVYYEILRFVLFLREYVNKQKQLEGFPTSRKRFTHEIGDAYIIKKNEWEEAIIYLSKIENYLGK